MLNHKNSAAQTEASPTTFTDHNGQTTAYRSFDPFGKPRMGDGSLMSSLNLSARLANNLTDTDQATRRGFTDHEHLDEVEIIHMNGRVYDYNLGRFLSVDPLIQGVGNSQGINPYSYVLNNPLSFTDPSGYSAEETEVKVKVKVKPRTGSRIARTETVTANVGSSEVSLSGGSEASQSAVAGAIGKLVSNGANTGGNSNSLTSGTTEINSEAGKNKTSTGNSSIGDAIKGVGEAAAKSLKRGGGIGLAIAPIMMGNGEIPPDMASEQLFEQLELSSTDATTEEQKLYLFRIGGGKANNLKLSRKEKELLPPGKSLLIGSDAQTVAAQFRAVTGNNDFSVTGQISLNSLREAGFDAIPDPTRNFINHARLTHIQGVEGFSLANRQKLSTFFTDVATP